MREPKWGVLERFRVRPAWRGRVDREHPQLLREQMARRAALVESGAHVLGPFELPATDGAWLCIAWQFPDRAAADPLRRLPDDPLWRSCVEHELDEGWKFDPFDSLPGFG